MLEWNSRLANIFFGDVQCNFDVLWCWKARNHSADIVGKVDNLFILFGDHHPPQGRHPLSPMPCGWMCCSSFYVMPQRMIPSSQDFDLYDLTLSTSWVSRDFLNALLKTLTTNMAPCLRRCSSRHAINCVITALPWLVCVLGHAFSCEWTRLVREEFLQTMWYWTYIATMSVHLLSEPRISCSISSSPRSFALSRLTSMRRKWRPSGGIYHSL